MNEKDENQLLSIYSAEKNLNLLRHFYFPIEHDLSSLSQGPCL